MDVEYRQSRNATAGSTFAANRAGMKAAIRHKTTAKIATEPKSAASILDGMLDKK
jgi:hypothetical protein